MVHSPKRITQILNIDIKNEYETDIVAWWCLIVDYVWHRNKIMLVVYIVKYSYFLEIRIAWVADLDYTYSWNIKIGSIRRIEELKFLFYS